MMRDKILVKEHFESHPTKMTINLQTISDHMSQLLKANEGFYSF